MLALDELPFLGQVEVLVGSLLQFGLFKFQLLGQLQDPCLVVGDLNTKGEYGVL